MCVYWVGGVSHRTWFTCVRPNVHAICGHLWYAPITQFIVDWHDLYVIQLYMIVRGYRMRFRAKRYYHIILDSIPINFLLYVLWLMFTEKKHFGM